MIKFGPYIEKSHAITIGATYYMTGRFCKNGHIDKKLTSSNKCSSCHVRTDRRRAYEAEWKRKKREDPEFVRLENERRESWLSKEGVKENLYAKNRARSRDRYRDCPDYRQYTLERSKEYQKKNPDKARARANRWVANNPEKVRISNHYRRDHRRVTEGRDINIDLDKLLRESFGFCKYCTSPLFDGYHLDHIMPLALGGSNSMDNLQCICARCNLRKGAKHPDLWHEEIGWLSGQIKDC